MKKKMNKHSVTILILIMMLLLAACGNNETNSNSTNSQSNNEPTEVKQKEPVTISFISVTSQLEYGGIKDLIANWENETGNKVDIQAIQDDQYDNFVKAKLAGGQEIDVFQGQYQKYDAPNQMLQISNESFESRLNQVALDSMKYSDGNIYAFPSPAPLGSWGVYYNKDIFSSLNIEIPTTTVEFEAALQKIKESGVTPIYFAAKDGWTLLQHRNAVNGVVGGEDPSIWDKLNKNELQWKDIPGFLAQYEAVERWVKNGYINADMTTATYEQSQIDLVEGKAAIVIQGTFYEAEFRKKKEDANIGFFPLPNETGDSKIALSGASHFYISKNSKHPEEAKSLLRYLSDAAQVNYYLERQPGISAFKDVDATPYLMPAAQEVQAIVNSGSTSNHGDDVYVVPMPYDSLVAAYTELLAGKITAAQFVEKHGDMYVKNGKIAKLSGF